MNEIKITAPIVKALTEVEAGNVTFSYRSAPKIKGTRLVKAMSSEWLNKKIANGLTDSMLAKLFAAELVTSSRGGFGYYTVKLTTLGANELADARGAGRVELRAALAAEAPVLAAIEKVANAVDAAEARTAIVEELLKASAAAKTEAAQVALAHAAGHVDLNELAEARKLLVPLRTRAALKAISAIKAL